MTLCRRNWHVLPSEQLAMLLDTSVEDLASFLRVEEHANWVILGKFKPACQPVKYQPPTPGVRGRAAQIKRIVQEHFGNEIHQPGEADSSLSTG